MKKIAYIRVSTPDQKHDRQLLGLGDLCDELHIETISAVKKERPVYEKVMQRLKPGDVFVIWDLDRAYRSTRDALDQLDQLCSRNISIHIANLGLDTSTPYGVLIYTIIGALAQFERDLLSQRTKEGMEAARQNGKQIGRPRKLSADTLDRIAAHLQAKEFTAAEVALQFDMHERSLTRNLRERAAERG